MKKVLLITGDAGECFEVLYAKQRFQEAGYMAVIAAPSIKRMHLVIHDFEPGWDTYKESKGYQIASDVSFDQVSTHDYDAVLCIGGRAPEYLRHDAQVIRLVQEFNHQGKYIFAICHGIQILVTAGLITDKKITCYEHVKSEVIACGGIYISDQEAVQDGMIVTGQTWQSHPDFYKLVMRCLE